MIKELIGPGIVVYRNVFSDTDSLIRRYEKVLGKEESSWVSAETNEDGVPQNLGRNCKDFVYDRPQDDENDERSIELRSLYDIVLDPIKESLKDYEKDFPVTVEYFESLNIIKYEPNDFFNYHTDDGKHSRYTVSCVGYLNDDYEGGQLHFKFLNVLYTPRSGDLVVFPSAYIYAHAAYPVRKGTKYIVALMTDRTVEGHRNKYAERIG